MRAQCRLACRLLPALIASVVVLVALGGVPHKRPLALSGAAQWQVAVQSLQPSAADARDLARLQFADGLQTPAEAPAPSLASRLSDEYGQFALLAAPGEAWHAYR